jgi:hypothetical protein
MNQPAVNDANKPLRFIDTGKVKIGVHYVPRPKAETYWDTETLQRSLLPQALGPLNPMGWPTPRKILRWLLT